MGDRGVRQGGERGAFCIRGKEFPYHKGRSDSWEKRGLETEEKQGEEKKGVQTNRGEDVRFNANKEAFLLWELLNAGEVWLRGEKGRGGGARKGGKGGL